MLPPSSSVSWGGDVTRTHVVIHVTQGCQSHTSMCSRSLESVHWVHSSAPPWHLFHCHFRILAKTNAIRTSGLRRRRVTASQSSSSLAPRKQAGLSTLDWLPLLSQPQNSGDRRALVPLPSNLHPLSQGVGLKLRWPWVADQCGGGKGRGWALNSPIVNHSLRELSWCPLGGFWVQAEKPRSDAVQDRAVPGKTGSGQRGLTSRSCLQWWHAHCMVWMAVPTLQTRRSRLAELVTFSNTLVRRWHIQVWDSGLCAPEIYTLSHWTLESLLFWKLSLEHVNCRSV